VAFLAGTREGLSGMITIDLPVVLTACALGGIWLVRRLERPPTARAVYVAERAEDLVVDVVAQRLKVSRKITDAAKTFAGRVRERADRNAT